jgi:hypothetical protein
MIVVANLHNAAIGDIHDLQKHFYAGCGMGLPFARRSGDTLITFGVLHYGACLFDCRSLCFLEALRSKNLSPYEPTVSTHDSHVFHDFSRT